MLRHQRPQQLDRRLRGDVAGIRLDAQKARLEERAEPRREALRVGFRAEALEHAELALEDRSRPVIAARGKLCGEHAAFRRAAEMEPFHHSALAAPRERQEPAGAGAGDAEGVGKLLRRERQHLAARGRRAEWPDDAGRMKAFELGRVQRCRADAKAHLAAGDDCGDEIAAAAPPGLCHREGGQRDGRTGMRAGAGLAQAVELEGVGEGAERQRRLARIEPMVEPRHRADARASRCRDHAGNRPRPRQVGAEDRAGRGIDQTGLGRRDDRRRQIRVIEAGSVGGEPVGSVGNGCGGYSSGTFHR
jgi:hypothetical protein